MILLQRIYLVVVLLRSCLQDHPLVRTQHRLSHLTNLIFYARFLLKGHHSQVVKVASVSCIVFLKRPFLKIFNLMVAAKGYGLLAASVFSKSHLDECLVIVQYCSGQVGENARRGVVTDCQWSMDAYTCRFVCHYITTL